MAAIVRQRPVAMPTLPPRPSCFLPRIRANDTDQEQLNKNALSVSLALIRGKSAFPGKRYARGMTIDTVRGHGGALRWGFASGSFEMTRPLTLALGASLLGATLLAGCATTAKTGGAGDSSAERRVGKACVRPCRSR